MITAIQTNDSVVVLNEIDWTTYQRLRGVAANANVRMTYDNGVLILMSPSKLHERISELIGQMVLVWTDVFEIPRLSAGSTTIHKELLQRGFEPDKSFYLEHEADVRARDEFDPNIDPPPDLSIEVDVTHLSTARMPIYAAFGIPELWRWHNERIVVYRLEDGHYLEIEASVCLPAFPLDEAQRILERRLERDETALIREFREIVQRSKDA